MQHSRAWVLTNCNLQQHNHPARSSVCSRPDLLCDDNEPIIRVLTRGVAPHLFVIIVVISLLGVIIFLYIGC